MKSLGVVTVYNLYIDVTLVLAPEEDMIVSKHVGVW